MRVAAISMDMDIAFIIYFLNVERGCDGACSVCSISPGYRLAGNDGKLERKTRNARGFRSIRISAIFRIVDDVLDGDVRERVVCSPSR